MFQMNFKAPGLAENSKSSPPEKVKEESLGGFHWGGVLPLCQVGGVAYFGWNSGGVASPPL